MGRIPRTLSLAAAAVTVLCVGGCATTDSGHDETTPGPSATGNPFDAMKGLPQGSPTPYAQLDAGMCSNHWGDVKADQKVGTVDCADRHVFEIISKAVLDGGEDAPYPGQNALVNQLRTACDKALEPVLAGARGSRIGLHFMAFDQASWDKGNRTGYCAVTSTRPTTGKVAGAPASQGTP
ncbi:septum formation family protein [Streptomyces sp. NPDC058572]|uniref:septum formation family protein n=1 Tax=Streptomyces sp. NPDC058572 TaxID=3346546 RepID=UPI003661AC05